jgi:hypothetical protein
MDARKTVRTGVLSLALLVSGCSAFGESARPQEIKNSELKTQVRMMADRKVASCKGNPYCFVVAFDWYQMAGDVDGMCGVIRSMPEGDAHTVDLIQKLDKYLASDPKYADSNNYKLPKIFSELDLK